ncbi:MAG: hypothetical protein JXR10_07305 [Cyclobacteriaceae bacterium]
MFVAKEGKKKLKNLTQDIGETLNLLASSLDQAFINLAREMNAKLRNRLIERNATTGTWRASGETVAFPSKGLGSE